MVSSTRRTAGCGPACPVVWQGRVGDHFPYADLRRRCSEDWGVTDKQSEDEKVLLTPTICGTKVGISPQAS